MEKPGTLSKEVVRSRNLVQQRPAACAEPACLWLWLSPTQLCYDVIPGLKCNLLRVAFLECKMMVSSQLLFINL